MVGRCKTCGSRDVHQKFSSRFDSKSFYCSKNCRNIGTRKRLLAYSLFCFFSLFIMGLIIWFSDEYLKFFLYITTAVGFILALPFALMSISGFKKYKEETQKKFQEKNYCFKCGEELETSADTGPLVCMNCGKKTPICGICNERITVEKDISKASPCGHVFHRKEFLDWLDSNDICPVCNEKISEVDISSRD